MPRMHDMERQRKQRRRGFNEAEALMPRMLAPICSAATVVRRFNEAEALMPRMPPSCGW